MPDDDGYTPPPSRDSLEQIYVHYPEYRGDIHPDIDRVVNLSATTRGGVRVYEFNKIRTYLKKIQRRHGYPMRRNHTVAFFNLVMFSIPFYTRLYIFESINAWDQSGFRPPDRTKLHLDRDCVDMRYREVVIYDIPNELIVAGLEAIPILGGSTISQYVYFEMRERTKRPYPIYENLVQPSGVNNKFIISNWDKIREDLTKHGY